MPDDIEALTAWQLLPDTASDFPNRIPTHWMPLPAPPSTEPLTKEQAEALTKRAT